MQMNSSYLSYLYLIIEVQPYKLFTDPYFIYFFLWTFIIKYWKIHIKALKYNTGRERYNKKNSF